MCFLSCLSSGLHMTPMQVQGVNKSNPSYHESYEVRVLKSSKISKIKKGVIFSFLQ